MFTRMDHVALSVRDLARAIAFYCDVLGFEKVLDREFPVGLERVIGAGEASAHIVHLRLGENVLELFDWHAPRGRPLRDGAGQPDFGLTHIGFRVSDFWATYADLQARGVAFLGEAVEIRPGVTVAYFRGPEGEVCEMREIVEG